MSTTENALIAHLVVRPMPTGALACGIDEKMRGEFAIHHVTLQVDPEGASCSRANHDAI